MKDLFRNAALNPGSLLVFTHEMDPFFYGAVVLVLAHDQRGTLGVIINKPHREFSYQDFIVASDAPDVMQGQDEKEKVLLMGGPVEESPHRVLAVYEESNASTPDYIDSFVPGAKDRFQNIASASPIRIAVDYTGWSPQALNKEINAGAWRVLPYDPDLVFRTNFEDIFPQAAKRAGLHEDLIGYIVNPRQLRAEKGGVIQAMDYIATIRPALPS